MLIKRQDGFPPTLTIVIGPSRWVFPQTRGIFLIDDSDTFQVLTRGHFALIRRTEIELLRSEDVFVVQRSGPPMHGDCCGKSKEAEDAFLLYNMGTRGEKGNGNQTSMQ